MITLDMYANCDDCGIPYESNSQGMQFNNHVPVLLTPETVEDIITNNGMLFECYDCGKQFRQPTGVAPEVLRKMISHS